MAKELANRVGATDVSGVRLPASTQCVVGEVCCWYSGFPSSQKPATNSSSDLFTLCFFPYPFFSLGPQRLQPISCSLKLIFQGFDFILQQLFLPIMSCILENEANKIHGVFFKITDFKPLSPCQIRSNKLKSLKGLNLY